MKFWEKRTVGPIRAVHPATGKLIEVDPQKDSKISSDLDMELRRMPALYAWYRALMDVAAQRLREASHEEHNAEEDLYEELRERAGSFAKKMTEQSLKMAIRKSPRMRKAFRERMEAEDMHQRMQSAVKVLEEKRWMLSALAKSSMIERGIRDNE